MKQIKYCKLVLILDLGCKIVEHFEFSRWVCSTELFDLAHFWGA
jgi:hypothetical protein